MKFRVRRCAGILLCVGVAHMSSQVFAASTTPQAAEFLPDDLIAVVTVREGGRQVAAVRGLLDRYAVTQSAPYRLLERNPQVVQARVGLAGLAAAANTDAWTGVAALLGRELTVGLSPGPHEEPRVIAVSVLRDVDTVSRVLEAVHILTGLDRDGEPDPARSRMVEGVRVFSATPEIHHCLADGALIVSNDRAFLEAGLRARRAEAGRLLDAESFQSASHEVPADAVAWGYVDMSRIRAMMGGADSIPSKLPNPLASLLFGGWAHTVVHSERAVLWATTERDALTLHGQVESATSWPSAYQGYTSPTTTTVTWSADALPRFLAEVSVARGWPVLFAEREALMSESAASDLANFSGVVTTLMGQMDFVDEFLPQVAGPLRLILARQDFTTAPYTPTPKLPAFALDIPLKTPVSQDLIRRLNTVSTQVLAFLNLNAGQENRPTFVIDMSDYQGHNVISAEYLNPPATNKMKLKGSDADRSEPEAAATTGPPAGIAYNFAPAAAVVGDRYVMSTSGELLRNIIDVIHAEAKPKNVDDPKPDSVRIDASELKSILLDNLEELTSSRMIEIDRPRKRVEQEIGGFLSLLDYADRLDVTSRSTPTRSSAVVRLALRKPSPSKGP